MAEFRVPVQISAIDLAISVVEKTTNEIQSLESASAEYKNGFADCSRVLLSALRRLKREGNRGD